jgi:ribosomal protein S18 acetylase RimI-like enzyme
VTSSETEVVLRRTTESDLDFVIALERHPENAPFIGQWSVDEHRDSLARSDREHWIVAGGRGERLGYVILYDLRRAGHGIYVKRIAIGPKSKQVGRRALAVVLRRAFQELRAAYVSLAVYPGNERAQRAYRASGFDLAELTDGERQEMRERVDPFPEDCLVMISRADAVWSAGGR